MEFGAFGIQVCQLAFQQEPKLIKATGTLNDNGVDVDVSAKLVYGYNRAATLRISMMKNLSNSATIVGTRGQITVKKIVVQCNAQCAFSSDLWFVKQNKMLFILLIYIRYVLFSDSNILVVFNNYY